MIKFMSTRLRVINEREEKKNQKTRTKLGAKKKFASARASNFFLHGQYLASFVEEEEEEEEESSQH